MSDFHVGLAFLGVLSCLAGLCLACLAVIHDIGLGNKQLEHHLARLADHKEIGK